MLALLPLLSLACLFLLIGNVAPEWGWRRCLLRTSLILGVYAVLVTELLSLVHGATPLGLSLAWLMPLVGSMAWLVGRKSRGERLLLPKVVLPIHWLDRLLLACLLGIGIVSALVAWLAPPNDWDSLSYRMARVAHWAQEDAVRAFPTGNEVQNSMPPASEFAMLHLYVLGRSDRLVNFVQWSAMVISLVTASLLAAQLGGRGRSQLFAMVVLATLPQGLVQASNTMTDYVVTLWSLAVASESLNVLREKKTAPLSIVFCGAGVALGMATKPTFFAFMLPFVFLLAISLLRHRAIKRSVLPALLAMLMILAVNAGHVSRNIALFGNPIANENRVFEHANQMRTLPGTVSILLRNLSLHVGTPWPEVNLFFYKAVIKTHLLMGLDPNDPRTTVLGEFAIRPPTTNDVLAGNTLHAFVYVAAAALILLRLGREECILPWYALLAVATMVLFSFAFKWQVFASRLHLPFFALFAPAAAVTLSEALGAGACRAIAAVMLLASWPWLLNIESRPLLASQDPGAAGSILIMPRSSMYFPKHPALTAAYTGAAQRILRADCHTVGVELTGSAAEYPLWVFLGAPREDLEIEWIVGGTPSARYEDPSFAPCAVVCDGSCPSDWVSVRGLPLDWDRSGMRLYLRSDQ